MNISDFFYEYFINPIVQNEGYNPVNTITYGAILIIAIYLLNLFFHWINKKYKVKINFDEKFMLGITPFIFFGSVLRVMEDAELLPFSFWFITPGIYILTFFPVIATLLIGIFLQKKKKIKLNALLFIVGLIFLLPLLPSIKIANPIAFLYFFVFFTTITLIFWLLSALKFLNFLKEKLNFIPFAAHIADATATFVSIDFFPIYTEQHVVPKFFISIFGSASVMYLLKIFIIIPILYLIQKYREDKQLSDFLRVCIFILGMAPAVRDIIRVAMFV
jgi:uncharacterized membrane protein